MPRLGAGLFNIDRSGAGREQPRQLIALFPVSGIHIDVQTHLPVFGSSVWLKTIVGCGVGGACLGGAARALFPAAKILTCDVAHVSVRLYNLPFNARRSLPKGRYFMERATASLSSVPKLLLVVAASLLLLVSYQQAASAAPQVVSADSSSVATETSAEIQANGTVIAWPVTSLNVRKGPHSVYYGTNGSVGRGVTVTVTCVTYGETVTGTMGTSRVWYKMGTRKYISRAYLEVVTQPGLCSESRTDDYKYKGQCPAPGSPAGSPSRDEWGYTKGQCTSFVAFRASQRLGVNLSGLGDARDWDDRAAGKGIKKGSMPLVGSVAVSNSGSLGHVAYVSKVNTDGSYIIEEYNWSSPCKYGTRTLSPGAFSVFIYP